MDVLNRKNNYGKTKKIFNYSIFKVSKIKLLLVNKHELDYKSLYNKKKLEVVSSRQKKNLNNQKQY